MGSPPDFDVVIIGGGLGGSAAAYALREAGVRILILERGDYLKQEPANWDPDEVISNHRYDPDETWVDQSGEQFTPRIYYNVGGSSKFFGGVALRYRPEDFSGRAYPEGKTVPWPIGYDDLAPYYDEAERLMWVHGHSGSDPTEPPRGDYPGLPLDHEAPIVWLEERLVEAGLRPFPLPVAVDQGPGGRCQKGSPCDGFPCKVRAKGDGENSFLRPALRAVRTGGEAGTGGIEVRTHAIVTRLNPDANGTRVASVEYRTAGGGNPRTDQSAVDGQSAAGAVHSRGDRTAGSVHTVTARVFVLAAGAANSAALLLRSASPRYPTGLANSSGQVGRNFMSHNNTVLMGFSLFRRNPTRFQKTLAVNDFYFPQAGSDSPDAPAGHVQMRGKVVTQNLRKSPRLLVRLFARFIAARSFDFWVMSEDLPDPENRIELVAPEERAGLPGIRLSRRLNNLGPHRALVKRMKSILRQIGLPIVIEREPSPRTIQHQCGTIRCGADPKVSVFDPECRSHDLSNLFAVDAGVFPSSASVNPALTVAANALRVGETISRALTTPER